jgi:hypothetical protein
MMAVRCVWPSRQIATIRAGNESGRAFKRLLVDLIISAFNAPLQSLIDAILDRLRIGVKEEQAGEAGVSWFQAREETGRLQKKTDSRVRYRRAIAVRLCATIRFRFGRRRQWKGIAAR